MDELTPVINALGKLGLDLCPDNPIENHDELAQRVETAARNRRSRKAKGASRRPVRMSWTPYAGPKGGKGWVSDTGEVRYQQTAPGEHEQTPGVGPEALFTHPKFAHIEHAGPDPDMSAIKDRATSTAKEEGFEPAEVHRRAAAKIDTHLNDLLTNVYAGYQKPEDVQKAAQASPHGPKGFENTLADYRARGGKAKTIDRGAVLDKAYTGALNDLTTERDQRAATGEFADNYYSEDDPTARAEGFLESANAGDIHASHLDPDTRESVVTDLAAMDPETLASHAAATHAHTDEGSQLPAVMREAVARAAGSLEESGQTPQPEQLEDLLGKRTKKSGALAQPVHVFHRDDVEPYEWEAIHEAAKLVPGRVGSKLVDPKKTVMIRSKSPLANALQFTGVDPNENGASVHHDTDPDLESLFHAANGQSQVSEKDVPGSAKNYGGVSGSSGAGEFKPGKDEEWDPNAVDVYRRVAPNWYVRRHGYATKAARDSDSPYQLVPRAEAPSLSSLPAPYWKDLETGSVVDEKMHEHAAGRELDKGREGTRNDIAESMRDKRDLSKWGAREYLKAAQTAIGQHKRTGNLVNSDDAIRDRAHALHDEHDFSDGEGMTRANDKPTRERLDALHSALKKLGTVDHQHDYDPDEIEPFDPALLKGKDSSRADTAEYARQTAEGLKDWDQEARETAAAARAKAVKESERFRSKEFDPRLRAVYAAAQNVIGLPTSAIDARTRASAQKVAQEVLRLRGRARRSVRMSLTRPGPGTGALSRIVASLRRLGIRLGNDIATADDLAALVEVAARNWAIGRRKFNALPAYDDDRDPGIKAIKRRLRTDPDLRLSLIPRVNMSGKPV